MPIDTTADSPYLNSSYITDLPVPQDSVIRSFFYPGRPVPDQLAYLFLANISALIKPLPVGDHTLKVRVFDNAYGYAFSELQAVDWHITVMPLETALGVDLMVNLQEVTGDGRLPYGWRLFVLWVKASPVFPAPYVRMTLVRC